MLKLSNAELAMQWLSLRREMPAAVFFQGDLLSVVTPDGVEEPFASSPFKQRLGECLVFLDDEHTRGTDLVFPKLARAAVTLGRRVTKDRLVQGKPTYSIGGYLSVTNG